MQKRYVVLILSLLVALLAQLTLLRSMLMKEELVEATPSSEMQQATTAVPNVEPLEEEVVMYDTPATGYAS